jgi:hypothetical protein
MLLVQRPIMPFAAQISYLIWILGAAGTLFALGLIWHRRQLREFPAFLSYLMFHAIEVAISALIYRHYGRASWQYYYEYWITQAIGFGLRFAVIYEIFYHLFRPYEGLRRASQLIFRWAGGVLLVLAIWIAIAGPSNEPVWAMKGAVVMERSINIVQCGLLALLFLFASYFALSWRNYVFGIALGFGVIAAIELLASALATQSRFFARAIFDLLPRISYDAAALIWVAYLAVPEPSRQELKVLPQHDLEKWNQELLELLQRPGGNGRLRKRNPKTCGIQTKIRR